MPLAKNIEAQVRVIQHTPESFWRAIRGERARGMQLGAGPAKIRGNMDYPRTGRPMSLGQQVGQACGVCSLTGCVTYADPALPPGDQNGCPGGWNGCGDTVGISQSIAASGAGVEIQVSAAISFTPRYFIFTGPAATFQITSVRLANGGDSHFGAPIDADIYRFDSFTEAQRAVSWPTFENSPPLSIFVNNTTVAAATFSGILQGVASHAG